MMCLLRICWALDAIHKKVGIGYTGLEIKEEIFDRGRYLGLRGGEGITLPRESTLE